MSNVWYARYAGDYGRDTAHLSLAEHGAYTLLLDHYYSTAAPIPKEKSAHYKICRAGGEKEERAAVDSVMRQFFRLHEDGYRNGRADSELAKQAEVRERLSRNGRRGAEKKWGAHGPANSPANGPAISPANGQTMAPQMAYPQPQPQPQEEKAKHRPAAPSAPGECDRLVAIWNGNRGNLPEVLKLTEGRRKKLRARIHHNPQFQDLFEAATKKAAALPFCNGAGANGWTLTFDWLIYSDEHIQKVLEGNYENRSVQKGGANGNRNSTGALRAESDKYAGRKPDHSFAN